jgi:hypothetical protein
MVHGFDEVAQAGEQSERITIAFLVLAWLFIALRVWTRTWIIASFGWDDATMILAGVGFALRFMLIARADALADGLYTLFRITIVYRGERRWHACHESRRLAETHKGQSVSHGA